MQKLPILKDPSGFRVHLTSENSASLFFGQTLIRSSIPVINAAASVTPWTQVQIITLKNAYFAVLNQKLLGGGCCQSRPTSQKETSGETKQDSQTTSPESVVQTLLQSKIKTLLGQVSSDQCVDLTVFDLEAIQPLTTSVPAIVSKKLLDLLLHGSMWKQSTDIRERLAAAARRFFVAQLVSAQQSSQCRQLANLIEPVVRKLLETTHAKDVGFHAEVSALHWQLSKIQQSASYLDSSACHDAIRTFTSEPVLTVIEKLQKAGSLSEYTELLSLLVIDSCFYATDVFQPLSQILTVSLYNWRCAVCALNCLEQAVNRKRVHLEQFTNVLQSCFSQTVAYDEIHWRVRYKALTLLQSAEGQSEFIQELQSSEPDKRVLAVLDTAKPIQSAASIRSKASRVITLVGRKGERKQVMDCLKEHRCAVLVGAPGIGKKTLAQACSQQFTHVLRVDATSADSVVHSFFKAAVDFKIEELNPQLMINTVKRALARVKSLVIFEHAQSYDYVKEYLPHSCYLVLSEETNWPLPIVAVNPLEKQSIIDFFSEKADYSFHNSEEVWDLSRTLDDNTLALSLAASYLKFQQRPLLSHYRTVLGEAKKAGLEALFSVSLHTIGQQYPACMDLLNLLSMCYPHNIPERIYKQAFERCTIKGELLFLRELLQAYALIQVGAANEVNIHMSLLPFLNIKPKPHMLTAMSGVLTDWLIEIQQESDRHIQRRQFSQAVNHVMYYLTKFGEGHNHLKLLALHLRRDLMGVAAEIDLSLAEPLLNTGCSHVFDLLGQICLSNKHYREALVYFHQALEGQTSNSLLIRMRIGEVQKRQGDLEAALDTFVEVLRLKRKLNPTEDLESGRILSIIGSLYRETKHWEDSVTYYGQALDIYQDSHNAALIGTTLNSLGLVYFEKGEYDTALDQLSQALNCCKACFGEHHTCVFDVLKNIARVYDARGSLAEALNTYLTVLDTALKLYGEEHPRTAQVTHNIGVLYSKTEDYEAAQQYLGKAYEVYCRVYTCGHLSVAETLNNLGIVYSKQDRQQQARACHEEALQIYGEEHSASGYTLTQLGTVCEDLEDYDSALKYFLQALKINPEDPADLLSSLGSVYSNQGNYRAALTHYEQALGHYKAAGLSSDAAGTLNNIGLTHMHMNEHVRAIQCFSEAQELYPESLDLADALNNEGLAYQEQGDSTAALEKLQEALELKEKLLDSHHASLATTLEALASVHDSCQQDAQALLLYQRALKTHHATERRTEAADVLVRIAGIHEEAENDEQALSQYQQALNLYKEAGPEDSVASTLSGIASVYSRLGDLNKALGAYFEAVEIYTKLETEEALQIIFSEISEIYQAQGEIDKALEFALHSLEGELEDAEVIEVLNRVGELYHAKGMEDQARDYFEQATAVARQVEEAKTEEASTQSAQSS